MVVDLFSQSHARYFRMIARISVGAHPSGGDLALRLEFTDEQPPPHWLRQLRVSLSHDDRKQVREFTPHWPDEFGDSQAEARLEQVYFCDWLEVFPPHTAPFLPIASVVLLCETEWQRYDNQTSLAAFKRRESAPSEEVLED